MSLLSDNKLFYTNTNYNDTSNTLINYNNLTGNSESLEHPLSKYARGLFFSPNYNKEFFDSINWANNLGIYKNQNNLNNPLDNNVLAVIDQPFHLSNAYKQMGADIGNAVMPGQQVGNAIAISDDGKVVAVAAPGSYIGYIRVYKWNDEHPGTWDQMGSNSDTVPPGIGTYDSYGYTIAISGDGTTVVCGSNSTQNPSGHQPPGPHGIQGGTNGYACIYKWNGSTKWDKVGGTLHGGTASEGFCSTPHSLALNYDGTILMAGASRRAALKGAVYVYELNNGQYTNIWTGLGTDFQHQLGQSIAMNATGSTFVTGGEGTWNIRGQANVYKREGNTNVWSKKASVYGTYLALDGQVDQFGWSAAMNADGTVFVIGGLGNIGNGSGSGYARVYEEGAGDTWDRRGEDFEGARTGAYLGMDVDINNDGTILLLSSSKHITKSDGSLSYNHGEVHVYSWDGLLWNLVNNEIILGKENYSLGSRLAINGDGTIIAAGAPGAYHNGVWGTGYAVTFKVE